MISRIYNYFFLKWFPFQYYIKKRNSSKDEFGERLCYCGHTCMCTCSNPDKTLFEESLKRGTINIDK